MFKGTSVIPAADAAAEHTAAIIWARLRTLECRTIVLAPLEEVLELRLRLSALDPTTMGLLLRSFPRRQKGSK